MRGSIKRRYEGSWSLILDLGYQADPATGLRKRRQKWVTFRGTKKEAQARLTELLRDANRGEYLERSKMTLGEWLTEWLEKAIKPPARRINTYRTYQRIIADKLVPALGSIRLQDVKSTDLKAYYTSEQEKLVVDDARPAPHHPALRAQGGDAREPGGAQRRIDRRGEAAHPAGSLGRVKELLGGTRGARLPRRSQGGGRAAGGHVCAGARLRSPQGRAMRPPVGRSRPRPGDR